MRSPRLIDHRSTLVIVGTSMASNQFQLWVYPTTTHLKHRQFIDSTKIPTDPTLQSPLMLACCFLGQDLKERLVTNGQCLVMVAQLLVADGKDGAHHPSHSLGFFPGLIRPTSADWFIQDMFKHLLSHHDLSAVAVCYMTLVSLLLSLSLSTSRCPFVSHYPLWLTID